MIVLRSHRIEKVTVLLDPLSRSTQRVCTSRLSSMGSHEAQRSEQSEQPREVVMSGRGWYYKNFQGFELGLIGLMCSDKYDEDEYNRSHFDQWFDFAIDEHSQNDEFAVRIIRDSAIPDAHTKVSIKIDGGLSMDSDGKVKFDGGVLTQGEGDGVGRFKLSFMVSHEKGPKKEKKRGNGWYYDDFPGYEIYMHGLTNGDDSLVEQDFSKRSFYDQWLDFHLDETSEVVVLRFVRKQAVRPARTKMKMAQPFSEYPPPVHSPCNWYMSISVKLEGGLSEMSDGKRVVFDGGVMNQRRGGDGVARFGLSFQVSHVEPPMRSTSTSSGSWLEAQNMLYTNNFLLNELTSAKYPNLPFLI